MFSLFQKPYLTKNDIIEMLIKLAKKNYNEKEVPVASIICEEKNKNEYKIINCTGNQISKGRDPTAHSEMIALRLTCRKKKMLRLPNYTIFTTLEPCLMCSGAIILARLKKVFFLAYTEKGPGLTWLLSQRKQGKPKCNHYPKVEHCQEGGKEYQKILRSFFQERR